MPTHPQRHAAALVLLCLGVTSSCQSGPRVDAVKPDAIAAARTFGPMQEKPLTVQGSGIPEDVGRWIADAVTAELTQRGYQRAENPDLVGRALVAASRHQGQWIEASTPGSLPRPVIQTQDWIEGTLVIELFDRRTNELAWRATAREGVRPGAGEQAVRDAVRRMFTDFPAAR